MNTNDASCHIHIIYKESKQICLSVNSFANLCPFIIRKNKVFLTNSDKSISFFLSFLDFMSTAKHLSISSVNVLGFAKVMQHITETALFS